FFITNHIISQKDTTDLVRYSDDYVFNDGFYISFDQVSSNKPLKPESIISEFDPNDFDFFDKVTQQNKIYFYDDFAVKKEIDSRKLWGYCRSGTLYINYNKYFNRIPMIGSICHFVSDVTVLHERMPDPFFYNSYYSPINPTIETNELRQYVVDFETGKVIDYSWQNLETIFMRDVELFDEFNELKKGKKKKLLFLYVRKFNERNPLYLNKIVRI
ncbi:MAG: hypothetical protein ABIJ97_13665, partial [Bacteroidota bacterium]